MKGTRPTASAAGARGVVAALAIFALCAGTASAKGDGPGERGPDAAERKKGAKKGKGKQPKTGPIGGSRKGPSARYSQVPIGASGAWRAFVHDSPSPYVYPVGVSVQNESPGDTVADPTALSGPNGGSAVLTSSGPDGPIAIVDLGRLTGGRIQISVGANTGVPIRIAYSEARRFLGPAGDVGYSSQGRNDDPSGRVDLLPPAPGIYTIPGVRGAQRYLRIDLTGTGSAAIDYVRVLVTHFRPAAGDYVGRFYSSDHLLNRIWWAGAYTLNVDTYGDPLRGNKFAVTDGAKRDRLVWLGDVPIELLAGMYTTRQMPRMLRRTLQMFTCQQYRGGFIPQVSEVNVECREPGPPNGPPRSAKGICTCVTAQRLPSYTAWFAVGAGLYYRMTADPRVEEWLPVVRRTIRFFAKNVGGRGLFVTGATELNWHPPDVAGGEDAATNALWVRALQSAATLEKRLGNPRRGRRYARMGRRLSAAIRAALFDPTVGALRLNTYDLTGNRTQDAQVQGILAGVLRGAAANSAFSFLSTALATPFGTATGQFDNDPFMGRYISPFQSGWEVLGRLQYYQAGPALDLIRRLWGRMVDGDPGDTLWEKMTVDGGVAPYQAANPDGSPIIETQKAGESSLAHGWAAGPTAALSAYVLGMRPRSAGWTNWLVEPQPADLTFAQGSVGTPEGKLGVRWERAADDRSFKLTVKVPRGTTGTVAVPLLGRERTIARDGRIVFAKGRGVGGAKARASGGYVRIQEHQPGTHTYAWAVG